MPMLMVCIGSIAAVVQSLHYGAVIPAGSLFAMLQSAGATLATPVGIWFVLVSIVFAACVLVYAIIHQA